MERTIRKAIAEDAKSYVEIKEQLPIAREGDTSASGGFLLGTNKETYEAYINMGFCYTALNNNKVVGFGVTFPDAAVKQSDIWTKKDAADWLIDISDLENNEVGYIDQLAFTKGNSRSALILAYNMIKSTFENGAEYVLTTTVRKPVLNLAAIPFIKAVGGVLAGSIDEVYPEVGEINSFIYLITKQSFNKEVGNLSIYNWLRKYEI